MVRGRHKPETKHLDLAQVLLFPDPTRALSKSYNMKGKLGAGAFGSVFQAEKIGQPREMRAVKVVSKTSEKSDMKYIQVELEAMIKLGTNPHVLKLYDFFEDRKAVYLVMELCNGGDFADLDHKDLPLFRQLFRGVTMGISYCHEMDVAHRDVKFENCLITDDGRGGKMSKVIDFGLASIRIGGDPIKFATESLGTKYFVAPEVVTKNPKYGVMCDVWSLGVMLYILLTEEHPMSPNASDIDTRQLFKLIREGRVREAPYMQAKVKENFPGAREVLDRMLIANPDNRAMAKQCLEMDFLGRQDLQAQVFAQDAINLIPSRLAKHRERSKFEKVLVMVQAHLSAKKDSSEWIPIFEAQDNNQNGVLEKEEMRAGFQNIPALKSMVTDDFDHIWDSLDLNADGRINYSEWLASMTDDKAMQADDVMQGLFKFFDQDNSGTIAMNELSKLLGAEEARRVMDKYDKSKDNRIAWDEFKALMHEVTKRRFNTST
jgi:calcium-dependent protein kinase